MRGRNYMHVATILTENEHESTRFLTAEQSLQWLVPQHMKHVHW